MTKFQTFTTDEQAAEILSAMVDPQTINLEGTTVHTGQHATAGTMILVEASAGLSLAMSEHECPITST